MLIPRLPQDLEELKQDLLSLGDNVMYLSDVDCCLVEGSVPGASGIEKFGDNGISNQIDKNIVNTLQQIKNSKKEFIFGINSAADLDNAFSTDNLTKHGKGLNLLKQLCDLNEGNAFLQFCSNNDFDNVGHLKDGKQHYRNIKCNGIKAESTKEFIDDDNFIKFIKNSSFYKTLENKEKASVIKILNGTFSDNKTNMMLAHLIRQRAIGNNKYFDIVVADNNVNHFQGEVGIRDTLLKMDNKFLDKLNFGVHFVPVRSQTNVYGQPITNTFLSSSVLTALQNPEIDFSQVKAQTITGIMDPDKHRVDNKNETDAVKVAKIKESTRLTADQVIDRQNKGGKDCDLSIDQLISNKYRINDSSNHYDWIIFPCISTTHSHLSYTPEDKIFYRRLIDIQGEKYKKLFIKYAKELSSKDTNKVYRIRMLKSIQCLDGFPVDFIVDNRDIFTNFMQSVARHHIGSDSEDKYYIKNFESIQKKLGIILSLPDIKKPVPIIKNQNKTDPLIKKTPLQTQQAQYGIKIIPKQIYSDSDMDQLETNFDKQANKTKQTAENGIKNIKTSMGIKDNGSEIPQNNNTNDSKSLNSSDKIKDQVVTFKNALTNFKDGVVNAVKEYSEKAVTDLEKRKALQEIKEKYEIIVNASIITRVFWRIGKFFGSERCEARCDIIDNFKNISAINFGDINYHKLVQKLNIIYTPQEMTNLNRITVKYKNETAKSSDIAYKAQEQEKESKRQKEEERKRRTEGINKNYNDNQLITTLIGF